MSYESIHAMTEAILFRMVEEGAAELREFTPDGIPQFIADSGTVLEHIEIAGGLADDVPWVYPLRALRSLVVDTLPPKRRASNGVQ